MPNGALTWRDVAAPDFRPAMEGFQNFAATLNSALSAARGGLKEYDQTATDAVNKAFAADIAMQNGDPEAYATHKAALIAGSDLSRLSLDSLQAADAKYGQLQQRQLTGLNITDTEGNMAEKLYTRGREHGINDAKDAAAPMLAQLYAAADADNTAEVNRIRADPAFQGLLSKMGPDEFASVMSRSRGLTAGNLSQDSTRFGMNRDRTEYAHTLAERADGDAVDTAMGGLINSSTSMSDFQSAVQRSKLTEPQKLIALQRSSQYSSFIDLAGAGGADMGGGLGGMGGAIDPSNSVGTGRGYEAVVGYGKYGAPSKPITSMTMGEVYDFGRSTLIPRTKAAGVGKAANGQILGSSAAGAYQITGSTLNEFAPKVLGTNWKSLPFSAENQDRVAEAIFNSAKGSAAAMMGRWESIKTTQQANQLRGMPWAQARQVILAGEGGNPRGTYTPSQARQVAAGTQVGAVLSENANRATEVIDMVLAGTDKNTSSQALARMLVKPGGDFENADVNTIRKKIDDFAHTYHVSASLAAAALRRSIGDPGTGRYWGRVLFGNGFLENTGHVGNSNIDINPEKLALYGNAIKNPQSLKDAAQARVVRNDTTAAVAAAPAALQDAQRRVLVLQNAMANGRAVGPQLAAATRVLNQLQDQARELGEAGLSIR